MLKIYLITGLIYTFINLKSMIIMYDNEKKQREVKFPLVLDIILYIIMIIVLSFTWVPSLILDIINFVKRNRA